MARFRYSGTNWEGRQWFLTAGGVTLGKQVEARWPDSHPADGTVASKGHDENNPSSDHRPRPFGASPAVVRALDVGEVTEDDGLEFAELLREGRDPRIKYVLHENRIFSSYPTSTREPWAWAHLHIGHPSHVHVSFTDLADTDNSPWDLGDQPEEDALLPINAGSNKEDIRLVQKGLGVGATGVWDADSVNAVKGLAVRASTGDPKGRDGTHVNGLMYHQLIEEIAGGGAGVHDHDGRYVKDITVHH